MIRLYEIMTDDPGSVLQFDGLCVRKYTETKLTLAVFPPPGSCYPNRKGVQYIIAYVIAEYKISHARLS